VDVVSVQDGPSAQDRPSVRPSESRPAIPSSLSDAVARTIEEAETDGPPITPDDIDSADPDGRRHPDDIVSPDEDALSVEDGQPLPGPCGPDEGWSLPDPGADAPNLTPDEAYAAWSDAFTRVWLASTQRSHDGYRVVTLAALVQELGPVRSRPWVHERLNDMARMEQAERLRRGRYVIYIDPREIALPLTVSDESGEDASDALFADNTPSDGVSA
jgi:hypothetical protein